MPNTSCQWWCSCPDRRDIRTYCTVSCESILACDKADMLVLLCFHVKEDYCEIFFKPDISSGTNNGPWCWNIKTVQRVLARAVCNNTVTPRYNAVVGRHLLGPHYKRGTLWDPVDLFDIIIPRQGKGQAKFPKAWSWTWTWINHSFRNIQFQCSRG